MWTCTGLANRCPLGHHPGKPSQATHYIQLSLFPPPSAPIVRNPTYSTIISSFVLPYFEKRITCLNPLELNGNVTTPAAMGYHRCNSLHTTIVHTLCYNASLKIKCENHIKTLTMVFKLEALQLQPQRIHPRTGAQGYSCGLKLQPQQLFYN